MSTDDALLIGTGGKIVFGIGPAAFHPPNHFSITALASSGEMSPTTTMVVKSGRIVASWNWRTAPRLTFLNAFGLSS